MVSPGSKVIRSNAFNRRTCFADVALCGADPVAALNAQVEAKKKAAMQQKLADRAELLDHYNHGGGLPVACRPTIQSYGLNRVCSAGRSNRCESSE